MLLPPPTAIGAPERFQGWRQGQPEAVLRAIDSPRRFVGLVLPTGSGKSLSYVSAALLAGWRTAILTSTKGLQSQLLDDFASIGLVDVRGQANYQCVALAPDGEFGHLAWKRWHSCEDGPCRSGVACSLKEGGCLYYDAVARARQARLVVTNYAYWLAQHRYGSGLGRALPGGRADFEGLVLDEAHSAPEELGAFLSCVVSHKEIELLLRTKAPATTEVEAWARWATAHSKAVAAELDRALTSPVSQSDLQRRRHLRALHRTLVTLAEMREGEWLVTEQPDGWAFDPLWPARFAEACLFLRVPRVILASATFTRKTAHLLGIGDDDLDLLELPSTFPVGRRPVYYVPTVRVDFRWTPEHERTWLARIDQICRQRRDRKGIIHTVSYARRNLLLQKSEHRDRMLSHDTGTTRTVVERFKAAPPGTILVSPAITTGFDFPYTECEYQILCKLPFPDSRAPVMQARTAADKTYPAYVAAQELVQAVGRGMRAQDDQCETFIIDDHFRWFVKQHRALFPRWFLEAVQTVAVIPPPPPPLAQKLERRP